MFNTNTNKSSKNITHNYSSIEYNRIINALNQETTIIIQLKKEYEKTKHCITNLLNNTKIKHEIILLYNQNIDTKTKKLLNELNLIPNITLIENKNKNDIITYLINLFKTTKKDIVILNSDVIVTPHWLNNFIISAYEHENCSSIVPLTNFINTLEITKNTSLNNLNKNSYYINKISNKTFDYYLNTNFSIYIKQKALKEIKLKNTYKNTIDCIIDVIKQFKQKGLKNIIDPHIVIYPENPIYLNINTFKIEKENTFILKNKYSESSTIINQLSQNKNIQNIIEKIHSIKNTKNYEKILFITNEINNLPNLNKDYYKIEKKYDTYILTVTPFEIKLWIKNSNEELIILNKWILDYTKDEKEYETLYFNIFRKLKIDLIYIRFISILFNYESYLTSSFIIFLQRLSIETIYEATKDKEDIQTIINNKLDYRNSLENSIKLHKNNIDFKNKHCVVYTAISGNYDTILKPRYINSNFEYICFTDNPNLKSDFWKIQKMDDKLNLDNIRKARHYKILPHKYLKEYDYSLWIDANFCITNDITHYINTYSSNNKILCIKHEERDCIYEEAQTCIKLKKDTKETINKQIKKYKKEKYPPHNGLIASGILFRDHNDPKIIKLMNEWYNEVINESYRDQLSFNYVCWKNNINYDICDLLYYKNEYFQRTRHIKEDGNTTSDLKQKIMSLKEDKKKQQTTIFKLKQDILSLKKDKKTQEDTIEKYKKSINEYKEKLNKIQTIKQTQDSTIAKYKKQRNYK